MNRRRCGHLDRGPGQRARNACAAVLVLALSPAALGEMATGGYTGDGTDNRAISVGFQPDVVFVKGNTGQSTVCRISTMVGDLSKPMVPNVSATTNRIQSLDADGFTVGSDSDVNSDGTSYYWVAFKAAAGELYVDSYVGNSNDDRSIGGVGFQPDYVIVLGEPGTNNGIPYQRFSSMVGDTSIEFSSSSPQSNRIQAFEANGFQVGSQMNVNKSGVTYHYAAWKAIPGQMNVDSYTGDGSDNRSISDVGFQPDYVIIKDYTTAHHALHRPASLAGDSTLWFTSRLNYTNLIQALEADGFQLGNAVAASASVNNSGDTYHWAAFGPGGPRLTLSDHDAGQESDAFTESGSKVPAEILAFKLDPGPDTICVTSVVLRLTSIVGLTNGDWTNIDLVEDLNNNGNIDVAEPLVGGIGAVDQGAGTVTFSGTFPDVSAATNYILRADFASLSDGDAVRIVLNSVDITTSETVSGSTSDVKHREGIVPWMVTGTYTGNGTGQSITEVAFQPDVVFVKRYPHKNAHCRTSTMPADASKRFIGSNLFSNTIQSLDADGFTVGTDIFVNESAKPYHWIAFKATPGLCEVGSYTGSPPTQTVPVAFQPDYVIVLAENGQPPVHRSSEMTGDASGKLDGSGLTTNRIEALQAGGFQVGSNAAVNGTGTTYHYVAWKAVANQMEVGSYPGNGSDNRDIPVTFQPKWVVVQASASVNVGDGSPGTVHRPDTMTGDVSINFNWAYSSTVFDNCIQALQTTGFQVGNNQVVNQSGKTYYWMAFGDGTAGGSGPPKIVQWREVAPQ